LNQIRDFLQNLPFSVVRPEKNKTPYLFNSPHSGRCYSTSFRQMSCLDDFDLRLSEDRYVDLIFAPLIHSGATFMEAYFPRAYLDVNREAFELDALMFDEPLPAFVPSPSFRVEAGFGSVPRVVSAGKAIYDHKLPISEALGRLNLFYHPYHRCLAQELQQLKAEYGFAILIDCHSMPGQARLSQAAHSRCQHSPDIILGDAHGRACSPALISRAETVLQDLGFHVVRNRPYAGGYITCHYGRPLNHIHALQIEINRDLYLDPTTLKRHDGFKPLCDKMLKFGAQLIKATPEIFLPYPHAAE